MLMQFTHRHTSESFRGHSTQPVETYQKSYDGDVTIHIDLAYIMPADDINDDDSISRGTNQESHPSEGFPQSFYCKFQRIAPERKFL